MCSKSIHLPSSWNMQCRVTLGNFASNLFIRITRVYVLTTFGNYELIVKIVMHRRTNRLAEGTAIMPFLHEAQWLNTIRHSWIGGIKWFLVCAIICSGNAFSPVRRQAINWTNADSLSIGLQGSNFQETWIKLQFLFWTNCKMSPAICSGWGFKTNKWINK